MPRLAASDRIALLALAVAACAAPPAQADVADYVFVPYGSERPFVASIAAGQAQARDGSLSRGEVLAAGWQVTPRWFTQAYAAFAQEPDSPSRLDAWSWLNHWALSANDGPFAAGLLAELEHPQDRSEGDALTLGTTLQWDLQHAQLNLNLLLSRAFGAQVSEPASLGYQWQARWLQRPGWELGLQGFGELGPWNHWPGWSAQSHTLGPALFWTQQGAATGRWAADAAWLAGLSSASPRSVLRLRVRYEF
jgi:hypothetical protein